MLTKDDKVMPILTGIGVADCFVDLQNPVPTNATASPQSLGAEFLKLLRSPGAKKAGSDIIFIWSVENPYPHSPGLSSTIVNIEKTSGTIAGRWSLKNCGNLVSDKVFNPGPVIVNPDAAALKALDKNFGNFSFYQALIHNYGPLHISWSTAVCLNKASGRNFPGAVCWEHLLLLEYKKAFGCLPLKNRHT